jgi:hypothetical protein
LNTIKKRIRIKLNKERKAKKHKKTKKTKTEKYKIPLCQRLVRLLGISY